MKPYGFKYADSLNYTFDEPLGRRGRHSTIAKKVIDKRAKSKARREAKREAHQSEG